MSMEGVISPENYVLGLKARQAGMPDPLLMKLCRVHTRETPRDLVDRIRKATEASRERQCAIDALIAEQEAERDKRKKLREVTKENITEFAQSTIRSIKNAVCRAYDVSQNDLVSDRRTANLTLPRHVAYYLAKELSRFSYPAIGRHFGGRDHTTILHGHRKIAKRIRRDKKLASEVASLIATLSQKEAA